MPEHLLGRRVVPDTEAGAVAGEHAAVRGLLEALDSPRLTLKDKPEEERVLDILAGHLRTSLAANFSQSMKAVDTVLADVAGEFDGADPLRPNKRRTLDSIRGRLLGLADQLTWLDVELDMPEPGEELLALLRKMVKWD